MPCCLTEVIDCYFHSFRNHWLFHRVWNVAEQDGRKRTDYGGFLFHFKPHYNGDGQHNHVVSGIDLIVNKFGIYMFNNILVLIQN